MPRYDVALLMGNGKPGKVLCCETQDGQNRASHLALYFSNLYKTDTCVVQSGTDTVLVTLRYVKHD